MKAALFNVAPYETSYLEQANQAAKLDLTLIPDRLTLNTVSLAAGCEIVSGFVTDNFSEAMMSELAKLGVKLIALRCAGYDHVDLEGAAKNNIIVVNAANYSPTAIAEHAVLLLLAVLRHFNQAQVQIGQGDFLLHNLLGLGLHGRRVGIIGTGCIGTAFARICQGMGCQLYGYDPYPNDDCRQLGMDYLPLPKLLAQSEIISLHCLLDDNTHHMINAKALAQMKPGAVLVNTARGPVVDTEAVLEALDSGQLAGFATDVYEFEKGLFFTDHTKDGIKDELFLQLMARDDVVITAHQAFFTKAALEAIATTTIENIVRFEQGKIQNQVS